MGFKCGIVGLPNVGKSTIFNAMTSGSAHASNYPFCTIDPNIGIVQVRDDRLFRIAELVKPGSIVPTTVEFVDIAGLVEGASKGEGLGNQFLGHIRSVDAIAHIVRCFDDPEVVHVAGGVDPVRDIEVINTELILADLATLEKRLGKYSKVARAGDKEAAEALCLYNKVSGCLDSGRPARVLDRDLLQDHRVKELNLLTAKPLLYVANVSEDDLGGDMEYVLEVGKIAGEECVPMVILSGKIESEVVELPEEEREVFLEGLGLKESGLDKLAKAGYRLLGFITFFTAGKKEVRAWTVETGTRAPQAAGVIHSDFERGFIRAEVVSYEDFNRYGAWTTCKDNGVVRLEGKEYMVRDGDIVHFRVAV